MQLKKSLLSRLYCTLRIVKKVSEFGLLKKYDVFLRFRKVRVGIRARDLSRNLNDLSVIFLCRFHHLD